MATFFGEVLPLYSRAVDEDEEDDVSVPNLFLDFKSDFSFSGIIIGEGINAALFVENYLLNKSNVIGAIKKNTNSFNNNNDDMFLSGLDYRRSAQVYAHFYDIKLGNDHYLIMIIRQNLPEEEVVHLTNELFESIIINKDASFKVYALKTENESKHITHISGLTMPFLRELKTSHFDSTVSLAPLLDSPNCLSGMTAAIMTFCQIFNIGAYALICYSEVDLDIFTIKSFIPFLSLSPFRDMGIDASSVSLQHIQPMIEFKNSGNLYI